MMPYLRVDLDALKRARAAAPVIGVSHQQVMGGLNELWAWCWTENTDEVEAIHLEGIFGTPSPRLADALVAFGFLDRSAAAFRVKGAETYLRLRAARSAGGKTGGFASGKVRRSKANAKQSRSKHEALTPIHPYTHTPNTQQKDSSPAVAADPGASRAKTQLQVDVETVWSHWVGVTGQPAMEPGREAFSIIGARLKERITVDQLCQAADGAAQDEWSERGKHDGLKYVFGSQSTVMRFIKIALARAKAVIPAPKPEPAPSPPAAGTWWREVWDRIREEGTSPQRLRMLGACEPDGDGRTVYAPTEIQADWIADNLGPLLREVSGRELEFKARKARNGAAAKGEAAGG